MNNAFLAQLFDWGASKKKGALWFINGVLRRLGIPFVVRRAIDPTRDMTNLEQRLNLWHLASQPLAYGVEGNVVELGCFDGKTAVIFARVIEQLAPDRQLHLYDHFRIGFNLTGRDIQQEVINNFQTAGCKLPVIHNEDFRVTVPGELPEQIAFIHIDCGFGDDVEMHRATVLYLLQHLYPRMPQGAIAVLMDYHDPTVSPGFNFGSIGNSGS
ncbi:MAG: hypothetical protein DCF22_23835 [Leptolyngbya sp.]|nr:MAG: hypothetical protein DCF22_23835 [Leptolyngbya sp.]